VDRSASSLLFDHGLKVEVQSESRERAGRAADFSVCRSCKVYMSLAGRQEGDRLLRVAKIIEHLLPVSHADAFAGRRMGAFVVLYLPGVASDDALPWWSVTAGGY